MKNTDNKSCAGVINTKILKPIAKSANRSQRGFVKGRQGLGNVVDIDTQARILDLNGHPGETPAIAPYDFAAAFPIVAHRFLFLCLAAARLPTGIITFFSALYDNNQVYANIDGTVCWLFEVLSGVLQGCPASGSLFVIAINPCLKMINASIGPNDICRAFADDIATVLESIRTLAKIESIFEIMRRISNLSIKSKKCVLIPLGGFLTDDLRKKVHSFLKDEVPSWKDFTIASAGEYLGFWVGPQVMDKLWKKAQSK
jgi:hypothetical protein